MNQQNAFERIAELEAKLAIATANCEQAVKERDELRAQVAELRGAILGVGLGDLDESSVRFEDRIGLRVAMHWSRASRWNTLVALVARLRAEALPGAGEPAAGEVQP